MIIESQFPKLDASTVVVVFVGTAALALINIAVACFSIYVSNFSFG